MARNISHVRQICSVLLLVAFAIAIVFSIYQFTGAVKIIEWSKSIGFLAFGLAIWVGMIVKLADTAKADFLPEWERVSFCKAITELRQQIWACFYFTLVTAFAGILAGIFLGTSLQDGVAILVLFLTVVVLEILFLIPAFWTRITGAIGYLHTREKQEVERSKELEGLIKAFEKDYAPNDNFNGYHQLIDEQ